jgi:hypothetical protein
MGFLSWNAVWANTDNLTTSVLVDLSAEEYTSLITIERIKWIVTAGIEFTLLWDATSNEHILSSVLAPTEQQDIDFTWNGLDGIVKTAAGSTGDLVLTTTSAASADEISLYIWYRVD